ncbi:D-2-hydroxyglutarate dehydrogenase YdiJ [Celerinatantimonas yamalensis]|uniref:FAD-binding and (Fe-S)-binding domain-containing protein n=1 Tax=Celerinatantimonas yamalensis TaxID=559956 RepID=A0ABW9G2E9_9GAMM
MIPRLSETPPLSAHYQSYLKQLEEGGFQGDIETRYASRLAVATDNSVYQLLPQAVIFPKHIEDVQCATRLASDPAMHTIKLTPRGGGTGTNGQSLTDGIVVDLSRYMNQLIELNVAERWVRVQSGMIKDALNELLRPHGLFFAPDLSTSNRATLGGMVNTDASGQGSLLYGKTSDHVVTLTAVTIDGERLETGPVGAEQALTSDKLYLQVSARSCIEKRALIDAKFPALNRFLTGYDLKHSYDPDTQQIDLTRLLCGSEGSLAFICEATLDLTPIPNYRTLVNITYGSFEAALRHSPALVHAKALSVETVDSKVLNLARQDIIWHSVHHLFKQSDDRPMDGINIVEFAGNDLDAQQAQVDALCQQLEKAVASGDILGYQICDDLPSIEKVYAMRKKSVGLLGKTKGRQKPVPFTEDTCVPPEHLADYIMEFRALLDSQGLKYGMFGHVDAGVLHVRPALDLCDPKQERLMREISDQVVALTAKYGGLMWGEHGKGFRSEYSPAFFGDELFIELRRIKGAFDPYNQLNPGKICTPLESEEELVSVDSVKRGTLDRQIPITVRDSFSSVMDCNGNGLCFNYATSSPMCPSFKVSYDRRFSPKGRAGLMREWLRQFSQLGVDPSVLEQQILSGKGNLDNQLRKVRYSLAKKRGEYDFSHEVMDAMQTCLACKACATGCPIQVDVPQFRSRFLFLYHSRYQRPLKDYMVGYVENYVPLMAKVPRLFNALMASSGSQKLTKQILGMVDIPQLSYPTLKQRLPHSLKSAFDLKALQRASVEQRQKTVLIVQDPFTSFYEADVVADFVKLVAALGFHPVLLPFKPNGKAQHIKGFLAQFAKTAASTAAFLNQMATLNIPMVGVDPALVLCYRDEYDTQLADKRGDFQVLLAQEWLQQNLSQLPHASSPTGRSYYLLGHCTEKALLPGSDDIWAQIFAHFGTPCQVQSVGCCGMAGTYGHDASQVETSKAIYALSWQKTLEFLPSEQCLATGYSCRSQVKRFDGVKLQHPVQALLHVVQGD